MDWNKILKFIILCFYSVSRFPKIVIDMRWPCWVEQNTFLLYPLFKYLLYICTHIYCVARVNTDMWKQSAQFLADSKWSLCAEYMPRLDGRWKIKIIVTNIKLIIWFRLITMCRKNGWNMLCFKLPLILSAPNSPRHR